ncbi:MAG: hypothetical protein GWM90_29915, partial [Gemmatimonadetes bacterium]|nr:hypothetical protein [Gemmatimonadota bacterium]NIU79494.1 hypothetical protein [Gammaproteobacteria bacterium]NIX48131.1 hypothetical protein [Gemmatimonadota bacterium]
MRGHWKMLALATVAVLTLTACAGDEAAEEPAEETTQEMPAESEMDMGGETAEPQGAEQAMALPEG